MPETVAVHHPRDPSRPTVIRADYYDPDRHTLWQSNPGATHEDVSAQAEEKRPNEEDRPPPDTEVAGLPDGYWAERSGSWYSVFAPAGTMIDRVQGADAAAEAAQAHAGGDDADA